MASETLKLFFGIQVSYPVISNLTFNIPNPFGSPIPFSLPSLSIKVLFYMGLLSTSYYFMRFCYQAYKSANVTLRSLFNQNKYLDNEYSDNSKYYAVIYGVANRAGNAYAKFLYEKGFNLILIERDM